MLLDKYYSGKWRPLRTIGEGGQGKSTLVERISDHVVAVQKRVDRYECIDGIPLEMFILHTVLPRSRRIVESIGFSVVKSTQRHGVDLIEWFQYCRGGDLENGVPSCGRLPEDFIWHCFIQIAEALDVMHNAGSKRVIHRDVKPNNVFLEHKYNHKAPWPNLKLGDFGVAVLEENTMGFHVPCWQGPELPLHSSAGDIWGLGAIIHWMAHGKPPIAPRPADFRGSQKEWEDIPCARKPMPLPKSYSDGLDAYMMRCLEWDPNDRISSQTLVQCLKTDRPR